MQSLSTSNPLFSGNIHGDKKYWTVGGIFMITGIALGVILPYLLTPQLNAGDELTTGQVIAYTNDGGSKSAEIYSFETKTGDTLEGINGIQSSSPSYQIGDKIEVYYSPSNPEHSWIKDDKNLEMMNFILMALGGYFFCLGFLIILLKLQNLKHTTIEVIIGTIGALSYGIPATITLPGLYYAYLTRPNLFFNVTDEFFTTKNMVIGSVFTVTGLLTIIGVLFMLRHFQKTGSNTWSKKLL